MSISDIKANGVRCVVLCLAVHSSPKKFRCSELRTPDTKFVRTITAPSVWFTCIVGGYTLFWMANIVLLIQNF